MKNEGILNKFLGFLGPESKFFDMVRNNDVKGITSLLQKKPELLSISDNHGDSALHLAASLGKAEAAKVLILQKASINARNSDGHSPLHLAVKNGNIRIVKLLTDKQADLNIKDKTGRTALFYALEANNREISELLRKNGGIAAAGIHEVLSQKKYSQAMELIEKYPDLLNETDEKLRMNPLHSAVSEENGELAEFLIKKGADVNARSSFDFTPLHYGAKNGNIDIIKMLLSHGADLNLKDSDGNTPLAVAVREGKKEASLLLKEKGSAAAGEIHEAVKKGDLEKVITYLKCNGDLANERDLKFDATPLLYAVFHGHREIFLTLMEYGALPDEKNKSGKGALHYAAEKGRTELAQMLLEKGADVNIATNYSLTPLHYAAETGSRELVKMFIKNGADLDAKSNVGLTALHLAAYYRNTEIAEILTEAGAQVNARDKENVTPLHFAARYGLTELARYLISKGADVNALNSDGATPLHFAAENGQEEIIRILNENRALLNIRDVDGRTPLHYGAYEGKTEVVRLLLSMSADPCIVNGVNHTPLYYSIDRRHMDMWDVLSLHSLGDPKFDASPLHFAAFIGKADAAASFIEGNTGVDIVNRWGKTPLHLAAFEGRTNLASMLIEWGASVNAVCRRGFTPLHYAALTGQEETAVLLTDKGADIDLPGESGMTPFLLAASRGRAEFSIFLLKKGVSIDQMDSSRRKALHYCARNGMEQVLEMLINMGADLSEADQQGLTPLHYAAMEGRKPIVELLLENGAPADIPDSQGKIPADYAFESISPDLGFVLRPEVIPPEPSPAVVFIPGDTAVPDNTVDAEVGDFLESDSGAGLPLTEREESVVVKPAEESAKTDEPRHHIKITIKGRTKPGEDNNSIPEIKPESEAVISEAPVVAVSANVLPSESISSEEKAPFKAEEITEQKEAVETPSGAGMTRLFDREEKKTGPGLPREVPVPDELMNIIEEIKVLGKYASTVEVDPMLRWSAVSHLNRFSSNIKRFYGQAPGFALKVARHKLEQLKNFQDSWQRSEQLERDFQNTLAGISNIGVIDTFNVFRSSQPSREDLAWFVNSMGVKVVINLCNSPEIWQGYTLAQEEEICSEFMVDYYNFPFELWDPEPIEKESIDQVLDKIFFHAKPILVHSFNGADRVSVIAAAYRISQMGWSLEDALKEAESYGFEKSDYPNQVKILEKYL